MEIARLARNSDWSLAPVFREALEANGVTHIPTDPVSFEHLIAGSVLLQPLRAAEPLEPREGEGEHIDIAALADMLRPGGAVGRAFPGYEHRPPQVHLLESIGGAFNESHHLMAEAGTGTGKSLAYLLPAIAYAVKNHTRVVVSTNTINLQDQLFRKDLPDLQRILADEWGNDPPFRAALLKGRSNYLCPRRFLGLKARPGLSADELRGVARILVWLPRTQTGDQGELSLPLPSDRFVWSQVAADSEGCTDDRCQREMGGRCFRYRARREAEAAHVLVVNHALLLADAAAENRVLPAYRHLVVDEAHHIEDAVTDQLSFRADSASLSQLFTTLLPAGSGPMVTPGGRILHAPTTDGSAKRSGGLLGELLGVAQPPRIPALQADTLRDHTIRLQADVAAMHTRMEDFWKVLGEAITNLENAPRENDYDIRLRITDAVRGNPSGLRSRSPGRTWASSGRRSPSGSITCAAAWASCASRATIRLASRDWPKS